MFLPISYSTLLYLCFQKLFLNLVVVFSCFFFLKKNLKNDFHGFSKHKKNFFETKKFFCFTFFFFFFYFLEFSFFLTTFFNFFTF